MSIRSVDDQYVADIWRIARESWIRSRFDPAEAMKIAEPMVKQKFGSVLMALQLIAVIMQILYTLYQWWSATKTRRPSLEFNDHARAHLLQAGYAFVAEVP